MYRLVGYFFIASSSLLFLGLYKINCRSFLQIEMNYGKCGVEKKLIQKRVEEYWQGLFPNVIPHVDVVVKSKKKLEFILNLPEKKDKSFFSSVEKDLANFLSNEFGYKKSFTLTLFENE